jgi:hypothetical protein
LRRPFRMQAQPMATLAHFILGIRLLITLEKMVRVTAEWVVSTGAVVAQARRSGPPSIGEEPSNVMGLSSLARPSDAPVATAYASSPDEAGSFTAKAAPESVRIRYSVHAAPLYEVERPRPRWFQPRGATPLLYHLWRAA